MEPFPPYTGSDWEKFLQGYSEDIEYSTFTPPSSDLRQETARTCRPAMEMLRAAPAGEASIRSAEERLGVVLPPSYRNFLLASNGWNTMSYAIDLVCVEDVVRLADVGRQVFACFSPVEDPASRLDMLGRCLLITEWDWCMWLLSPDEVAANGEWKAYDWCPKYGLRPDEFPDFATLVASRWQELR